MVWWAYTFNGPLCDASVERVIVRRLCGAA
jgi:hypothetical protein